MAKRKLAIYCQSEPFAGVEEDSEDEESQKFGDLSYTRLEPFYFAPAPSESSSKRGREVSRHDIAFIRGNPGSCRYGRVSRTWFSALEDICGLSLTGMRCGSGMRQQS